nr:PilZ domain-containing protein [uncultured Sphingomonas sp.]
MIKARLAHEQGVAERRSSARFPVELDARVRELGSEGSEVKLLNISTTGFMAESDGDFEVGSRVWLILPGRDRANAIVRWIAGRKLGAEFAEPTQIGDLTV